jgi:uncharacterized membrane protein
MRRYLQFAASVVALLGFTDSIYLTIHHYNATEVPCGITGGCEQVLTSTYAEIAGIPLGVFGGIAYFTAFALAFLSAYGNELTWKLFGVLATMMAAASCWFIFVQAYYIHAYCQYCLGSALTSFTLFVLFLISLGTKRPMDVS